MSKVYLGNAFSVNMLNQFPAEVKVNKVGVEEFCQAIRNDSIVNAIGHESTAQLVNVLCGTSLSANRIQVRLNPSDELYVISLNFRLEEGKVYNIQELQKFLNEGKISFYKVQVQ